MQKLGKDGDGAIPENIIDDSLREPVGKCGRVYTRERVYTVVEHSRYVSLPSTGGSPPFIPDDSAPLNNNEPYLDWLTFILAQTSIPQTFSTSYGDDEQTVSIAVIFLFVVIY